MVLRELFLTYSNILSISTCPKPCKTGGLTWCSYKLRKLAFLMINFDNFKVGKTHVVVMVFIVVSVFVMVVVVWVVSVENHFCLSWVWNRLGEQESSWFVMDPGLAYIAKFLQRHSLIWRRRIRIERASMFAYLFPFFQKQTNTKRQLTTHCFMDKDFTIFDESWVN